MHGPKASFDYKPKILIIEDDDLLSGMYITKFSKEGFNVIFSKNGEEGLEKARQEKPDIILLDILLPKMSGFDVLKKLKEDGSTAIIPVIVLTNISQETEIKKGFQLGAVDYLIKVYNIPSEVVNKVKKRISYKYSKK